MLWAQPWRGFGRRSWIFFLRCQSTSVSQGSFNLECVEFLKWTVRQPHRSCSWEKVKHKGQWRLWSQHQTYEATVPVQNRWGFPGPGIQVDRKEQKSGIWVGFCFFLSLLVGGYPSFCRHAASSFSQLHENPPAALCRGRPFVYWLLLSRCAFQVQRCERLRECQAKKVWEVRKYQATTATSGTAHYSAMDLASQRVERVLKLRNRKSGNVEKCRQDDLRPGGGQKLCNRAAGFHWVEEAGCREMWKMMADDVWDGEKW